LSKRRKKSKRLWQNRHHSKNTTTRAAKRDTTVRDATTTKIATEDTGEIHHATVQTTDAIVKTVIDPTDIAQVLLVAIVQSLPGGTGIALPETIKTLLLDAKKTADEETTRDHLPLQSKNATTSVENAGVHLLHPAKTIHEASLLDLDANIIELCCTYSKVLLIDPCPSEVIRDIDVFCQIT
jgi:hypothetical protein